MAGSESDQERRESAPQEPVALYRRTPSPALQGLVTAITGYAEHASVALDQREDAALVVPLIIGFGAPFRIGLGRAPGTADHWNSFAAGLFAGPVHIASTGGAACVQIDFTPLGALRVFGADAPGLAGRMVDIEDILGRAGPGLRDRLAEAAGWEDRLALAEAFVLARLGRAAPRGVAEAWRVMAMAHGAPSVAAVAQITGISRQRLAVGFRDAFGVGPKTVLRLMRFQAARRRALRGQGTWADIAAVCGFADQAHLCREFTALAGEAPTAWGHAIERAGIYAKRTNVEHYAATGASSLSEAVFLASGAADSAAQM